MSKTKHMHPCVVLAYLPGQWCTQTEPTQRTPEPAGRHAHCSLLGSDGQTHDTPYLSEAGEPSEAHVLEKFSTLLEITG